MKITKPVLAALAAFAESVYSGWRYEYRHEALLRRMTDAGLLMRRPSSDSSYDNSSPFHAGGGHFAGWIITAFGREILEHGGLVGSDTDELTRLGFDRAQAAVDRAQAAVDRAQAAVDATSTAVLATARAAELRERLDTLVANSDLERQEEVGDGWDAALEQAAADADVAPLEVAESWAAFAAEPPELLELDGKPAARPQLSPLVRDKIARERDRVAKRRAEQNAVGVRNTRIETLRSRGVVRTWIPSTEKYTEADAIAIVESANGEQQRVVDAFSGIVVQRPAPGTAAVPVDPTSL